MPKDTDEKPLTARDIHEVLIPAMEKIFATREDLENFAAREHLEAVPDSRLCLQPLPGHEAVVPGGHTEGTGGHDKALFASSIRSSSLRQAEIASFNGRIHLGGVILSEPPIGSLIPRTLDPIVLFQRAAREAIGIRRWIWRGGETAGVRSSADDH